MGRRTFIAFVCLLLLMALGIPCLAAETAAPSQALHEQMEQFRLDYGLNEQNFSICYYNTVTGEEYRWNDTRFMTAASTYKLPLNLYYYENEWAGEISTDTTISGVKLADCRYQTMVWSDNDLAIDMLYRIGNFRTYKDAMLRYFTMPAEQISSAYYADNNYCTSMMLDALKYLYGRSDEFFEMLGYMKQAQPENYFRLYVSDYEIAHKYGFFEGAVNDVGIVYTPQPFLLAVYTQDVGEKVVGRACEVLTQYTVEQYEQTLAAAEPKLEPESEPESEPTPMPEVQMLAQPDVQPQEPEPQSAPEPAPAKAQSNTDQTVKDNLWWMILVAASIFLAGDLAVLFFLKHRTPEDYGKRYERKKKP